MISPTTRRALNLRHLVAPVTPDRRLDDADQLLRVTRLRHPRVGAEPQPADALGDRGRAGAHDHGETGQPRADPLEVLPAARSENADVDDERVEPHRDERLRGDRARQRAEIPTERFEPVGEDLHESGVAVDNREPKSVLRPRGGPRDPLVRVAHVGRHAAHCSAHDCGSLPAHPLGHRIFTCKHR